MTALRGQLEENILLARLTSWRVGGPAERLYRPADLDDLAVFLKTLAHDEPITWLGLGSNLLIRDGGIKGTVIMTQGLLNEMTLQPDGTIRAEAGVSCAKLARFAARHEFTSGEFFAGIPGTVGGALAMNAGAFGGETWESVIKVEVLDQQGDRKERLPDEYQIAYREVTPPQADIREWFVAGHFQFKPGDVNESRAQIRELLDKRSATQPTGEHSGGSVFRNPPNNYAAKLIEACGLKGTTEGGAKVSEKHANFIINEGTATAADIEKLIERVQTTVLKDHGIELIPEVHIVGEGL